MQNLADKTYRTSAGFTLVEMAMVMAIMGLVLAGGVNLLSGHVDAGREKLTATRLQAIEEALVAYFVWHDRLPCPADGSLTSADLEYGRSQPEDSDVCDDTSVTPAESVIPWRTLGLQESESIDGWDRRITYHVSTELTTSGTSDDGSIIVRDGDDSVTGTAELTDIAAFVLISHGENGYGAWTRFGNQIDDTDSSTDELLNIGGAQPFADRRLAGVLDEDFDDMVLWRERAFLARATGVAFNGSVCSSATNLWASENCSTDSSSDSCQVAEAVLSRCSNEVVAGGGGGGGGGGQNTGGGGGQNTGDNTNTNPGQGRGRGRGRNN